MLQRDFFADAALPPAATWLGGTAPAAPAIVVSGAASNGAAITLAPIAGAVRWWVIRYRCGDRWTTRLIFGDQRSIALPSPNGASPDWIVVNAAGATGALSGDAVWRAGNH